MAIYYLNPYTQTNGTGTFASPWSPGSSSRTGLTNGDEVRILGNTNPLFFSTVYTATYGSTSLIIITAGGNLGTDFPAGSYLYIVESDAFCYVGSQTANTLTINSSLTPMPWANTVLGSTMTIRKVDTANNGTSVAAGTMYILGTPTSLSNVVVSDAWIDATTRVTDGSVKSIFRGASTTSSPQLYFDTSSGAPTTIANNTFNMQNSHIIPNPSTSSGGGLLVRGRDSVINVSQFAQYSTVTGSLTLGTATHPAVNTTFTIKTTNCYYSFVAGTGTYANSCTINITNFYTYYSDYVFGSLITPIPSFSNNTINHTNYTQSISNGNSGWLSMGYIPSPKLTINYSGIIDFVGTNSPSYGLVGGGGDVSINILPGTTIYKGRRATTGATNLTGRVYLSSGSMLAQKYPIYTANILSTITATANVAAYTAGLFSTSSATSFYGSNDLKKPAIINLEYPSSTSTANNYHATAPVNILQTYRDGSWDPIEILGIDTEIGYISSTASGSFPNVFRDTVTFRTTGPSLRSLLTTRTAAYWQPATGIKSSSYKNIKIPIVSGSNYTITGYIRSNYASSTTGDVIMSVIYNNAVLATQNMTSAMYNSWEQFTLSFTASATGEAYLVWEMYYPSGNMSYWLDDLSIVKS